MVLQLSPFRLVFSNFEWNLARKTLYADIEPEKYVVVLFICVTRCCDRKVKDVLLDTYY